MKSSRTAVLTAIAADVAIAVAKFTAFSFTQSSSMLSEAIHSMVDAGNSSLLLLGLHRARQPADEHHPFGYGKEVYFWTLLVALFIFIVGGGVSIAEGVTRLQHPEPIRHLLWNYATLAVAACFEGYSLYVGRREFHASEGVSASWKAIHASKDPSTFTVIFEDTAALCGLAIAFIGTLLDQFLGWVLADGIASILIGAVLVLVAVLLMIETKALLVGEGADRHTLNEIRRLAQNQPGIVQVGYPLTMYFGPDEILLTMNIRFAQELNRDGIERAIDDIETAVRERFPKIRYIYLEAESLRAGGPTFDPARLPVFERSSVEPPSP